MSLKDIKFKKFYDSDSDDIVADFYSPALSKSVHYFRLTGFFSSSSLAVAAKGISKLVRNGGRIELVTGALLRSEDVEAIKEASENPQVVLERALLRELDNIETEFVRDHVRALGWMVANKRLRMKVAIVVGDDDTPLEWRSVERTGIFHQKVGILEDIDGNRISFSGSDNETALGWKGNIEEFKVFRSWVEAEKDYVEADLSKFNKFWEGTARRAKVVDIPKAIEGKLVQIAPNNIEELNLDKWYESGKQTSAVELREYQLKAVQSWLMHDRRGILEMATGTGKTIVALSCIKNLLEAGERLVVIISSPFIHLSEQWIREFNKLDISCDKVLADSSQSRWKDKLVDSILDVENGVSDNLMVLTTHNTFSSSDFVSIIRESKNRVPNQRLLVIVDEVHGIGAPERRKGLIDEYDYRLGLSATPKRYFDLQGTDKIFGYFGEVVFEFTLKDAIDAGYLTPYVYKPRFTSLTTEEMERYETETRKVARAFHHSKDDDEKDEIYTLLCIKRQKIIRNAANKIVEFMKILEQLSEPKYCLIYCSPQQIRSVQNILNERSIIQHKFTEREGTKPGDKFEGLSERDFLIKQFSEGVYQVLVSMRCLDEGVDVPPARIAIMLDNSGNPREYVQRRGRVLRKFPGKSNAVIHDIIVEPTLRSSIPQELRDLERGIIRRELQRYRDFAGTAQNAAECLKIMENVEAAYGIQ
jgi:superfamily II DNA or RNA helicase